jgi:hypothetical protein
VIDVVRAAQRLPDARLSPDAKVVFRGYSQGAGASMRAGEPQPDYAPELNLVGVVGGGVPADLVQVALPLDGKKGGKRSSENRRNSLNNAPDIEAISSREAPAKSPPPWPASSVIRSSALPASNTKG